MTMSRELTGRPGEIVESMFLECRKAFSFLEASYGFHENRLEESRISPYTFDRLIEYSSSEFRIAILLDEQDQRILLGVQSRVSPRLVSVWSLLEAEARAAGRVSSPRSHAQFPEFRVSLRREADRLQQALDPDGARLRGLCEMYFQSEAGKQRQDRERDGGFAEFMEQSWKRWKAANPA